MYRERWYYNFWGEDNKLHTASFKVSKLLFKQHSYKEALKIISLYCHPLPLT